jgi:hypothetical protein
MEWLFGVLLCAVPYQFGASRWWELELEQFFGRQSERVSNPDDVQDRYISPACFKLVDVVPVQVSE